MRMPVRETRDGSTRKELETLVIISLAASHKTSSPHNRLFVIRLYSMSSPPRKLARYINQALPVAGQKILSLNFSCALLFCVCV